MPYQPVVDVAQIQLFGTVDRQTTINDIHFQVSGSGIDVVNLTAITAAAAAWWGDNIVPLLSEDWSSVRVIGTDLTTVDGPSVQVGLDLGGGIAGEAVPNNVAACVSFRTAQRGRSARGRNYVPSIPNSEVSLNTIQSVWLGDLLTAYNLLVGAGTFLPGWQFVVVSRRAAGVVRAAGLAIPITSVVSTSPSVRSMRSREVGHGI